MADTKSLGNYTRKPHDIRYFYTPHQPRLDETAKSVYTPPVDALRPKNQKPRNAVVDPFSLQGSHPAKEKRYETE